MTGGSGAGIALVPFLLSLAALALAGCVLGLSGRATAHARAINAVCNLSYPLFFLCLLLTSA